MNKKIASLVMAGLITLSVPFQFTQLNSFAYSSYERIYGQNRYQTSDKVSDRNHSSIVVLASGESFPDALSAVNISNKFDAATILTNGNLSVVDLLKKRGAKKVFLIGGVSSISNKLENKLKESGFDVERIGGINRYETSRNAIKRAGYKTLGVCSGQNYIDALAASALLKQENSGLLLVEGDKPYKAPENTTVKYTFGGVKTVVQSGGERISGTSRYGTAVEIANKVKNPTSLAVVSGLNYADALSATNLVVSDNAVIMPVEKIPYYDVIKKAKNVDKLFIVGGPVAISNQTMSQVVEKAKTNQDYVSGDTSWVDSHSELTKEQKDFLKDLNRTGNNIVSDINEVERIVDTLKGVKIPSISGPINNITNILNKLKGGNSSNIGQSMDAINKILGELNKINTGALSGKISGDISKIIEAKKQIENIKNKYNAFNNKVNELINKGLGGVADKVVGSVVGKIEKQIEGKIGSLLSGLGGIFGGYSSNTTPTIGNTALTPSTGNGTTATTQPTGADSQTTKAGSTTVNTSSSTTAPSASTTTQPTSTTSSDGTNISSANN